MCVCVRAHACMHAQMLACVLIILFCHLQYQRESEKTTMSAADPEARIISEEADPSSRKYLQDPDAGIFKGTCEFCHNDIKAFPTLEEQKTKPPEELYCCSSYSEFIQYMVKHPLNAEAQEDKLINVKPHLPYGSKQARKAAKERAAQRYRNLSLIDCFWCILLCIKYFEQISILN